MWVLESDHLVQTHRDYFISFGCLISKIEMVIVKYREQYLTCHKLSKSMVPQIDNFLGWCIPEADPKRRI